MSDYIVAIPSYRRPKTLQNKTMNVLKDYKIDPKRIVIFVADKEQKKVYEDALEKGSYNKLVVGKPGIRNIRNFMPRYFPEGKPIFYMDDDISHVFQIYNNSNRRVIAKLNDSYDKKNNKLAKLPDLDAFIKEGFRVAKEKKLDNWGVYPVENPYFMKPTTKRVDDYTSTNLVYLIGFMTGVFNNRKAEIRTIDDKEDYERSIKYYLKDGGTLRFNNVTCRTRCYKEPGGMQVERTKQRIHDSAVYLCEKYPQLCSLNTSKKSGYTEVRLRDKTLKKTKKNKRTGNK